MPRLAFRSLALAGLALALAAPAASAQPGQRALAGNIRYNAGQTVQPIFEGWSKNPDGTFLMHFGYLNRNHVEELQVLVGAENSFEPGGPDRGQPTYFYTRFNRRAFSIVVPKDWGKKELVWTLTSHGKTERAVGLLQADWEIDLNIRSSAAGTKNDPPTVKVTTNAAKLGEPSSVTLTAVVKDDGLPAVSKRPSGRPDGPPTFKNEGAASTPPTNVPQLDRAPRPRVDDRLSVTWLVWRGPAAVTFTPPVVGADAGSATATASFTKPGTYLLRAVASDRGAVGVSDVTIVVGSAP